MLRKIVVLGAVAMMSVGCGAASTANVQVTDTTPKKPDPVTTTAAVVTVPDAPKHVAPPLAQLVKESSADNLPILLYFGAVWCGPCAVFEKEVMPQASTINALTQWRFQKYDAEFGEGAVLAKQYNVTAFPTLVVMSPAGEEVDRQVAPQKAELFVGYIGSKLELAKVGPIKDDQLASVTDPKRLVAAARFEEGKAEPNTDRIRKLYTAALTLAKKQKNKQVTGEASFALLQLDAQAKDRKAHVSSLLAFAAKNPDSSKSVDALEGLTALQNEAAPRTAEIKKIAAKVRDAQGVQKNDGQLKRVAAVLRKFNDEDGAKKAEGLMTAAPAPAAVGPGPMMAMAPSDPLVAKTNPFKPPPPEILAKIQTQNVTARKISEDCQSLPHEDTYVPMRIYIENGAVKKAVVLDPELTPELKTCLEKGALALKDLPPLLGTKIDLRAPLHFQIKDKEAEKKDKPETAKAKSDGGALLKQL